ncbi:MAG: hypothetical protein KBC84_05300 [Proteobacteria bacterium]|nr:hypothetical protein [Pseudomonadota bacterium]
MENLKRLNSESDLFEQLGLEIAQGEVEVGQTYPIFGMITRILNDKAGEVVVEINHSIIANMNVSEDTKVELLKERAFESGIFVSTVVAKEPKVEVDCQVVIFGRKQGFNA